MLRADDSAPDASTIVPKSVEPPPAHDAGKALPLPDKPSLVVLPFQNMSGDPEQVYFVDGLVEDITTALSCNRSLFVIARNSAFTYKGRAVDVREIGRDLGVRYVLEGSVRRAGNRLRITASWWTPPPGGTSGRALRPRPRAYLCRAGRDHGGGRGHRAGTG